MGEPIRLMPGEVPRKSNTCLIGCVVSVVAGVVVIVVLALLAAFFLGKVRDSLTSEAPEPIPQVEFSQEESQELQQRAAAFQEALKNPAAPAQTLDLSAHDINVLLRTNPSVSAFSNSVYVDIADDTLSALVSMPLDMIPGMTGRYLNGTATLDIDVVNDRLVVSVQRFMMHGKEFPVQMLSQLEGELNNNVNQSPEVRALAQRIQDIQVQDGRVRVTLKGGQQ